MIEILKILKFLPNELKKKSIVIFIILFAVTLIEFFSLGSLLLLINSIFNPEILFKKIPALFNFFSSEMSHKYFILNALFIILAIFIVKTTLQIYFNYYERSFFNEITVNFQKRLYEKYLLINYFDISKVDSSNLIRIFTTEAESFRGYVRHLFLFLKEILILSMIIITLIIINYSITIVLFLISIIFFLLFYLSFNKKLKNKGNSLHKLNKKIITLLKYSFELIKEIKVNSREKTFKDIFYLTINKREKDKLFHHVIISLPRVLIELLVVFLILLISAYYIIILHDDGKELLLYLSTLMLASVRLIPSLTIVGNCFTVFKFYHPSYKIIYNELLKHNSLSKIHYANKIEINKFNSIILNNISFSYSNKNIFKNASLKISAGEKIIIQGKSGCGKSTLIHILLGLLKPNSGELLIDKIDYSKKEYSFKNMIGFIPQENYLIDESIKNNITFMHKMSEEVDEQKLIKSIKISNSLEFINNLSEGLKTNVGEKGLKLSGGQRQRVALARAIYTGKKFLIMDEPTSFQDKKGSKQIINNLIKIPNLTLIIISHSDYISNLFDKIYEIKNNIIVQK